MAVRIKVASGTHAVAVGGKAYLVERDQVIVPRHLAALLNERGDMVILGEAEDSDVSEQQESAAEASEEEQAEQALAAPGWQTAPESADDIGPDGAGDTTDRTGQSERRRSEQDSLEQPFERATPQRDAEEHALVSEQAKAVGIEPPPPLMPADAQPAVKKNRQS